MDERDGRILLIGILTLGGVVVYQGLRLKYMRKWVTEFAETVYAHMDAEFQEEVDEAFEEIVDNYDEM